MTSITEPVDSQCAAYATPADKALSNFFFMDVLRVYACFMIVLFHAHSISKSLLPPDQAAAWEPPVWWCSAIDLFFVMSGFLMVHVGRSLYGSRNGMAVFFARRLVRIPPLYWIYTGLFAAILSMGLGASHGSDYITPERFLSSLAFLPVEGGAIIPLGWTMNYEVLFYVVFGLTTFLSFPRGPLVLIAVFIGLAVLGRIVEFDLFAFTFWTDPILIDFVWGVALGVLYHRGARLPNYIRAVLVIGAVVPVYVVAMPFDYGDITRPFTFGLSAAMLVAAATLRNKEYDFGTAGKAVSALGLSAYSLYLSHVVTLKVVEMVFKRTGMDAALGPVPFIVTGSCAAVIVGYTAYLLLDKPLTAYLRTKIPKS